MRSLLDASCSARKQQAWLRWARGTKAPPELRDQLRAALGKPHVMSELMAKFGKGTVTVQAPSLELEAPSPRHLSYCRCPGIGPVCKARPPRVVTRGRAELGAEEGRHARGDILAGPVACHNCRSGDVCQCVGFRVSAPWQEVLEKFPNHAAWARQELVPFLVASGLVRRHPAGP